jgi:hypothetical protein
MNNELIISSVLKSFRKKAYMAGNPGIFLIQKDAWQGNAEFANFCSSFLKTLETLGEPANISRLTSEIKSVIGTYQKLIENYVGRLFIPLMHDVDKEMNTAINKSGRTNIKQYVNNAIDNFVKFMATYKAVWEMVGSERRLDVERYLKANLRRIVKKGYVGISVSGIQKDPWNASSEVTAFCKDFFTSLKGLGITPNISQIKTDINSKFGYVQQDLESYMWELFIPLEHNMEREMKSALDIAKKGGDKKQIHQSIEAATGSFIKYVGIYKVLHDLAGDRSLTLNNYIK